VCVMSSALGIVAIALDNLRAFLAIVAIVRNIVQTEPDIVGIIFSC